MIITGISVNGVGRFTRETRLTGFSPGLNILSAPNEAGKSTLFRALRVALFQRHNSKREPIKKIATEHAALPVEITVDFRIDEHDYCLTKKFMRSDKAELSRDGAVIARGAEADEAVWGLLGITPGSGRGEPDIGALGLIWVEQGRSFDPHEASATARNTLADLVTAEVGALVGGDRARHVLERVEADLDTRMTSRGPRAGGPLKAAIDAAQAARTREQDLDARHQALEEEFAALARLRADLARARDPAREADLRARREAAIRDLETARAARAKLETAQSTLAALKSRREIAEARLADAEGYRTRLAEAETRLAALENALAAQAQAEEQAQGDCTKAAEAVKARIDDREATQQALAAAEAAQGRAEAAQARTEARGAIASLRESLAEIDRLRTELSDKRAARKAITVTREGLDTARAAHDKLLQVGARLEAQAPRLAVSLTSGGAGRLSIDGTPLPDGHERPLTGETTIAIEGIGSLRIIPAGGARDRNALEDARADYAKALAAMAVTDLGHAEAQLDDARALIREIKALEERLAMLARQAGGDDGDVEGARAGLTQRIDEAQALIAQEEEDGPALAEDPTALRTATRARREALDDARTALENAQRTEQAKRERLIEARTRKSGTASQRDDAVAACNALALKAAEQAAPERIEQLQSALTEAQAAQARQQAEVEVLAAATPDTDQLLIAQERVQRTEEALDNHRAHLAGLERDAARHEEAIRRLGAEGLEEELATAREEAALAARAETREQQNTQALQLLQETIAATLASGRERFLAPVKQHLAPYLATLFPGAEIDLNEDFAPTGLARAGTPEGYDQLSHGTREQIAVLVRLALGTMLAEKGRPAPIILDDALVFSDDGRIEAMFDALTRAARHQQVIILTCRDRAFTALGGAMLRIEGVSLND
ncbi:AAA family ATPase [Saliniramus sp.]|uniref:AAA family ATPase n=1 Tax=Saliniramus sp. TaxID=2986772 RepID=UPI002BAC7945|nr:AAA family ATPase [Saliniramus sp.]HMB09315.1 AAA family ATPase [Saliniramus sp.]